jgi:hypothetical protein
MRSSDGTSADGHVRGQSLAAFAIFLLLAIVLLDRGLWSLPGTLYIGRETDPPQSMWFFKWWMYSLTHGLNPFITDIVWAPSGINLAWTTFVPLPAWISFPLQLTVGEPAAYNIIVTFAMPLAAFAAFLLCARVSGKFWPSMLGGYIFGFSPYILGEMLGHLCLIAIFPVPLIALAALKRLDGAISARRFAVTLAALLVAEFLCSVELFATVTLVGGFALLLAMMLFAGEMRARLFGLISPTIGGYAIATAVLSPYFYYLLAYGIPHAPIWTPSRFCADVVGFIVPRQTVWLGNAGLAMRVARNFGGNIFENGDYLGVAIIVFVEAFRRRYWRSAAGKFLTILLLVIVVAAMGPSLNVAGRQGIVMPWAIAGWVPLISNILPVRFMMYASLVIAAMASIWFAQDSVTTRTKCVAASIILISIAPNPSAPFWVSRLDLPAFFKNQKYTSLLAPGEIVMPLPLSQEGNSMYWQLNSDMYFRMAGGWTGISPFEFERWPLVNYSHGAIDLPEAADQMKAYIAHFGVQAVIADPSHADFAHWLPALAGLGEPSQQSDGVWFASIPAGSFAAYAKLAPAAVEARANALRFDAIVAASAKYLAAGNDAARLSALELQSRRMLPPEWSINAAPHGFADWSVLEVSPGNFGIAMPGSYEGLKPLMDRYASPATEVQYPAPARWSPSVRYRTDVIKPLLVIFSAAQLQGAAEWLKTAPPPELTTSFIDGVSGWREPGR